MIPSPNEVAAVHIYKIDYSGSALAADCCRKCVKSQD